MATYKADLHIHTVLSPCGDLEMSPKNIVAKAIEMQLNIIGITDHNSTLHCNVTEEIAKEHGILVLKGAEVTTKEELHCLVFFENENQLSKFQNYLDENMSDIKNDPDAFGFQVVVNKNEEIIQEVDTLLISAISQSLNQLEKFVHEHDGIFIPAHIDKKTTSITSQLGFIPPDLNADALEVSAHIQKNPTILKMAKSLGLSLISNSDAHFINQIGSIYTNFFMEDLSFGSIKNALKNNQVQTSLAS